MRIILAVFLLIGTLGACNLAPTPTQFATVDSDISRQAVFTVSENGGCMMMGANCARYELHSDGRFELYRANGTKTEATNHIDVEIVERWISLSANMDFPALKKRIGVGICRACVDGIDYKYVIRVAGDAESVVLDSTEHSFTKSEPFFAESDRLYRAMSEMAQLKPLVRR